MFECYFQNIKTKIIELLFEAKKSVKVISAFFTDKELFNLLCQLRKKGVTIELIIADEAVNFTSTGVHFEDFINIGGEFYLANRNDPKSLVHHKFCIVDGSTLITGSYNWTVRANHNKENIIITTNDNIVQKYETEFEFVKDNFSTKYNKLNEFSIKTGFHDLDQLIFGLNSTELIFLHGLPGMGKTSLMLNLAMNICKDMDQTVGYITTDFSAEYLGPKILSLESMIQIDKILTGRVEDYESHTLQEISEKLNNYNFR